MPSFVLPLALVAIVALLLYSLIPILIREIRR